MFLGFSNLYIHKKCIITFCLWRKTENCKKIFALSELHNLNFAIGYFIQKRKEYNMKKIISVFLAILSISNLAIIRTYASDANFSSSTSDSNMSSSVIESEPITNIKSISAPCYGEYELAKDHEENGILNTSASSGDKYESNNSFKNATSVGYVPNGAPYDYGYGVQGTLHRETWFFGLIEKDIDEDYYRFDLFGEATIKITLNDIPTDCDYDIDAIMI